MQAVSFNPHTICDFCINDKSRITLPPLYLKPIPVMQSVCVVRLGQVTYTGKGEQAMAALLTGCGIIGRHICRTISLKLTMKWTRGESQHETLILPL